MLLDGEMEKAAVGVTDAWDKLPYEVRRSRELKGLYQAVCQLGDVIVLKQEIQEALHTKEK